MMNSIKQVDEMVDEWIREGLPKDQIIVNTAYAEKDMDYVWGATGQKCTVAQRKAFIKRQRAKGYDGEAEETIRKENPNLPSSIVKELAEARATKRVNSAKAEESSAEEKAWGEALREYPDMTKDSIPNEVLESVAKGKAPLLALKDYEISQLKAAQKKAAIEEKNLKNKEKSTGSMNGNRSDGDDQFLSGLFG
jgi:hypothetical protein